MSEGGGTGPATTAAELVCQLERLIGQDRVADSYVRFRADLVLAQDRVREALTGPSASLDDSATNGHGPLPPAYQGLVLDQQMLASYGSELFVALERHGSSVTELSGLKAAAADNPALLEDVVRAVLASPEATEPAGIAERLQVPEAAVQAFGQLLAAPFVAAWVDGRMAAEDIAGVAGSQAGSCPRCGAPPALARLRRDDGKRILHCSLCGEQHQFDRVRCPFCGITEQADLHLLYVDEQDPSWIETCEQCQQYIKTFDERRLPEDEQFMPFVQDTATLYLDLLGEREGYQRRRPYVSARELWGFGEAPKR